MHDRQREREQLTRKLEVGLSIHMPAPRRIGKTWTTGRLAGDLRAAGWHTVELDVEGMSTPHEFARALCTRIEAENSVKERFRTHVSQRLTNLLSGGWGDKPLDALGRVDPIEFAETLIASLDEAGGKTAIIIDEISYFFLALAELNAKDAKAFAYKLRALVQRYKNVRWLITGSIGLDTIARRYELEGAFVDFETFVLEPFTPDEARSYMRDPQIQRQFNHVFDAVDTDFNAMFEDLGWLAPYYLKLIANEVRPSITSINGAPPRATKEDFDKAFEKLLQPNRKSEFAVWREHVQKNLPSVDRTVAHQALGLLSASSNGETEDTLLAHVVSVSAGATKRQLRDVLAMLVNDGLVVKSAGRYAFQSGLVRRYWQEYEAE
jgi:hypothetical protein